MSIEAFRSPKVTRRIGLRTPRPRTSSHDVDVSFGWGQHRGLGGHGRHIARGDLVKVSDDVAFGRDAYAAAIDLVREIVATEGSVTVAQLRDRMGGSRRPVLALLEHLDAQRVTRRVGDARTLR